MDIESYQIPMNICSPVNNDLDLVIENMENLDISKQPITIYIANLLEKLIKDMIYENVYDIEKACYCLNIKPPNWFYSLEIKYQKILINLIEPEVKYYIEKN
tara:strand:- start:882 stop:1187 length:306 start_codon:yes stop_codon:yes gene_type:complete